MAFLLPTTKTAVSTGQTSEFAVTNSAFDEPIPEVVGTQRLAGNIFWADPNGIREERVTDVQSSGGKGSPKQETTTTTFNYYADFAVMFAKGPAQSLRRIWGDGKLIYDATGATIDQLDGLNIVTYLGTGDQLPNSTIQAAIDAQVGTNSTPAYRDIVYILFDDMPLANFGNRIPAITAEFAFGSQDAEIDSIFITTDMNGNGTSDNDIGDNAMLWRRDAPFFYYEDNLDMGGAGAVRAGYASDGTMTSPTLILTAGSERSLRAVTPSGAVIIQIAEDSSIGSQMAINDQSYDVAIRTFDRGAAMLGGSENLLLVSGVNSSGAPENELILSDISLWEAPTSDNNAAARVAVLSTDGIRATGGMVVSGSTGEAWACLLDVDGNIRIYKATTSSITQVGLIMPTDVDATETDFTVRQPWIAHDPGNEQLLISVEGTVNDGTLFTWSESEGVRWVLTNLPLVEPRTNTVLNAQGAILNGTTFVHADENARVLRVNLSDGVVDSNFDGTQEFLLEDSETQVMTWDEPNGILWTRGADDLFGLDQWRAVIFSSGAGADINPRDVIERVAEETGIPTDNLELTNVGLVASGVKSYNFDARDLASNLIDPLLTVLQIDVADTDSSIEFVQRGQKALSFAITEDDMIRTSENGGEPFIRARVPEADIPRRVEVAYDDSDAQYQQGLQADERATNATPATGLQTQGYPGAMTADGARTRAQTLLYSLWSEQERFTTRLSQKHLAINPTDVGTITLNSGVVLRVRCTKATMGADFTVDFEAVVEQVDVSTASEITGDTGSGNQVTSPANVEDSDVFVFDTPLLRDTDEPPSTATSNYWSASGDDPWSGAFLFLEETETLISELGKQLAPIPFGVVTTPPPDATQFFRFEEDQSMVVTITRGEELFSTATELDVLNGANVLLIEKANGEVEFLQFQNVAVGGSANVLTLSRLLRGRRGTDTMANGIAADDRVFLMISSTYVNAFQRELSTIDTEFTYRGVTVGQIFEEGEQFNFTYEGRSLKPYAPVEIAVAQPGGVDTDLVFTWTRRTRLGGEDDISTTATDVPLGEDSEDYDLVIYSDATYATEVRTINVSSETATYASADITADGVGATVYFRVFQRSAQVGRGFASDQSTPRNL